MTESESKPQFIRKLTSLRNPAVKAVTQLRNRRRRDRQGLMLIEGLRELSKALDNGVSISQWFVCEELIRSEDAEQLGQRIAGSGGQVFHVNAGIFTKIAYREHPDGFLAVARQPEWSLCDLKLSSCPLIVIAVGLEKPGNLGAILRSADAAGADGAIVCDGCADLANPNVVRASIGTLFSVQVARSGRDETLQWLKKSGIQLLATSPSAPVEYCEMDLRKPCAFLVGPEHSGLSGGWMEAADAVIRIPMKGQADSLNVAMTATILLFEAVRQRH